MSKTKDLIRQIYFEKIAIQIARKSPESIRRKKSVPKIPETDAYEAACRHVANFLYNHGMEMSLFVSSIETGGAIPKKSLPVPVGRLLGLSEHKNLYLQVRRAVRPPKLPNVKGYHAQHHHHHHHHHRREEGSMTPSEAYRETANMLTRRAANEIRGLGVDPLDPFAAQQLYDEFKMFLNARKTKQEEPPPPPPPVQEETPVYQPMEVIPEPPAPRSEPSVKSSSARKSISSRHSSSAKTPSVVETSTVPESTTQTTSTVHQEEEDEEEDNEEEEDEEEDEEEEEEDFGEEEEGEEE
ncbi:hypothetical protein TVAG_310060 [Trichomonas vaginalis G3]|uniref:Uncharacterized protein n=1 Tax=Trichomonas vaginalis (strain ATCC PRA-98 / G3) TaxID=412133 RepID=A2EKS2_TRIV3|nr:hypothetical protein TVAGG3_0865390 [Trichomonas vaginalis G3]EAY06719.1 hypothetical protein TVAG_310060 [Trichomonas vaginalis G3]KAI5500987.1 hypothetical protein TVAGG3_0865390 [Trichomonas vaginalis G3]|eukprot:XP_001318942.1 hypothetical protein [Trichomonas vaginalis G3]